MEFGLTLLGYPNPTVVPLVRWTTTGKMCKAKAHRVHETTICIPCDMIYFRPEDLDTLKKPKLLELTMVVQEFMVRHNRLRTPMTIKERNEQS